MLYRYSCRWTCFFAWLMGLLLCLAAQGQTQDSAKAPLSLHEAEQLALTNDPLTRQRQAQASAFSERAVADGQLPDPQLKVGIAEVPLDDFDLGDHEDTELQVGIAQAFPRGRTLRYKSEQMSAMAGAEGARAEDQRRTVLKALRTAYVELFYQTHAQAILEENGKLFAQLRDITEQQYAAGRDNQHEVLRAQLELSLLDERLADVAGTKEMARAELAKWITRPQAERPLPAQFPVLPDIPKPQAVLGSQSCHPLMQAENAMVEASKKSVAVAREQYKPGWMLELMFTDNTAESFDLRGGADFFTAMITVDLPLFWEKRQDRTLAASQQEHAVAQFARADRLRELMRMAQGEYATWGQLGKRLELYRSRATLEAVQSAEATFNAYQNGITDFTTLARARMTVLDTQLGLLRVQVDRAKAQANLLYLAGDCP